MTDTVDKSIDEILQQLCNTVYQHGKATRTNTPFHYGEPMKEAKQAIKALIEQEVVEARFEELRSLALEYSQCSIPERAVLDILKVLKPQLKDKS